MPPSVQGRLWLGIAVSIFAVVAIAGSAVMLTREQERSTNEAHEHAHTAALLDTAARQGAATTVVLQFYVFTGNEEFVPTVQQLSEETIASLEGAAAQFRTQGREDEAALIDGHLAAASEVSMSWSEVIALVQAGDQAGAIARLSETIPVTFAVGEAMITQADSERELIHKAQDRVDQVTAIAFIALIIVSAIGIGAAIIAGTLLSRSVLRPLAALQATASRVTSGDLEARADTSGPVEIGQLGHAFNNMTEALLDASHRRELEAEREQALHELHERVKELTALQRVSRLLQDNQDINEVLAGIAAIIPPAMHHAEASGCLVTVNTEQQASVNFAETKWVLRAATSSENGSWINIAACYHEAFPEADIDPFSDEEFTLLTAIAEMLASFVDRREANALAEQSMERFGKAFHSSPAPVSIVRMRDGRVIDVNSAFLEVLGWERDEALSRTINELNMWESPEERERFTKDIAAGGGTVTHGEYALCTRNGETRYVYGSTEIIKLDGEDCVLSIFYDITARKEAESALYDAEQRWSSLVDHTSDIVTIVDTSGKLIFESPSSNEILGFAPGELIGRSGFDFIHHEDVASIMATFQELVADPSQAKTVEFRFQHKDGSYRRFQAVGSALLDAKHKLTGVVILSRDVTDQRQMEEHVAFQARLLHTVGQAAIATDAEARVTYANQAAADLYGLTCEEMLGMRINEVMMLEQFTEQMYEVLATLTKGETWQGELAVSRRDGSRFTSYLTVTPIMDEEGNYKGSIGVSADISERLEREREIAFQARLLEASGEAVIATDAAGKINYWNPAAETIYGWPRDEAMGSAIVEIISDVSVGNRNFDLIREAVRDGAFSAEWNVTKKDGTVIPIESTLSPLTDASGEVIGVIGVSRDIAERKRAEDTIRHMAYHDSLTGLPNRLLLNDRFGNAMAHARRKDEKICVMSMDLDRFKVINDTLGHAVGDELLMAAADRMRAHAREGDTVARVGGDEFVLLAVGCSEPQDGLDVADRLVEAFREPFEIGNVECHTSLSIGISVFPKDGETAETLLSAADAAMYAVKANGRDGQRAFGPDIDTHAAGWLALETDLRRALTRGEIEVFYQPQVSVATNEIVGIEALARWRHPEHGLMLPADFIPMAEETGLIVPLGDLVMARACADAAAWDRAGGAPVTLAVNVSLRQIQGPDFMARVERILKTTGLPPQRLELEITENTALTHIGLTLVVAQKLADMGIRLALDDFGTGNTALRYLSELPVDTLKIDQSFVQNVASDNRNSEITASIIALGQALSLNVIAEGVETEEQLEFLRAHNCQNYQGFLFSTPQPPSRIAEMLGAVELAETAAS